ncbi:MAG: gamma-glutamyl kinase [Rhodobacteraceae bacterium]|nr:gamma-glutamyl kinase [Paracoccaceae bacterium]
MLLFAKQRLVLLAVPKTGSTAWTAALASRADMVFRGPPGIKHMSLRRYQRHIAPLLETAGAPALETVAVIREPEDWLGSWYRYRQRPAVEGQPVSTKGVSFDAFVQAYLCDDRPAYADLGRQARFVAPIKGRRGVDHLFRYDDPDGLRRFVEGRLGGPITLPRRNESPVMALTLSAQTRALLRRDCAADYALYDGVSKD